MSAARAATKPRSNVQRNSGTTKMTASGKPGAFKNLSAQDARKPLTKKAQARAAKSIFPEKVVSKKTVRKAARKTLPKKVVRAQPLDAASAQNLASLYRLAR